MDRALLADWLEGYKRAWEEADPDRIASLFTPGATYAENPFGEPMRGREAIVEYWTQGPQRTQTNISFAYEILAISEDMGFVNWWAEFDRVPSGSHVALNGVFALKFDEAGLCASLREWWHRAEESR